MSGRKLRLISLLLVFVFVLTSCVGVFAEAEGISAQIEESQPSTIWEAARITELSDEETQNGVIYLGTQKVSVDERGKYILTIYRDGNTESEAGVVLGTIDASATIKEDYDILNQDTSYTDLGGTVMERNANVDSMQVIEDYLASVDEAKQQAAENEETAAEDEEAAESEDEPAADTAEDAAEEDDGKSELAKIKEEQTGMETREVSVKSESGSADFLTEMFETYGGDTTEEEYKETSAALLEYTQDNLGDYAMTSSDTIVTFAAGETEKQIEIEVFEDDEAEDNEIVIFTLSAPLGAELGDLNTCSMSIVDDEEREETYIGFESGSCELTQADNKLVLTRTGADYRMASAVVALSGGETKEVYFKPYETRKEVEMNISGSGSDKAVLQDFKGCAAGEITECQVEFKPEKEKVEITSLLPDPAVLAAGGSGNQSVSAAAVASENTSFDLPSGIDAHNTAFKLRVDYSPNQRDENGKLYGNIVDPSYEPEVIVGRYFFPENFDYGHYCGYGSPSDRSSEYCTSDSVKMNEPDGYGYLEWYDWRTWNNGESTAYLNYLNNNRFSYYGIDWQQSTSTYGGQKSRFQVYDFGSVGGSNDFIQEVWKSGAFDRTITTLDTRRSNDQEGESTGSIKVSAIDNDGNKTPIINLYFYGVAAMYRKFKIKLDYPGKMTFIDGKGTSEKMPCTPTLGVGHDLRYYGQYLSINGLSDTQDGIIPGELIGYKVTTNYLDNDPNKIDSFYYMAEGHKPEESDSGSGDYDAKRQFVFYTGRDLSNIEFNDIFLNCIDSALKGISNGSDYKKWTTDLQFTPLYKYKDVKVQIMSNPNGSFEGYPTDDGKIYHFGDKLELAGVPANDAYEYAGYKIEARATDNMNEVKLIDEIQVSDQGQPLYLTLGQKNCTFYQITPQFKLKAGNYIRLNKESGAENLYFYNVLTDQQLDTIMSEFPEYKFEHGDLIYIANPEASDDSGVSEAQKLVNMITVKPGKVYQVQAYGKTDKSWKPQFINEHNYGSKAITTETLDFVASTELAENIIDVKAINRDPSSEKITRINGRIVSSEYSVRQSSETIREVGVQGLNVYSNGGASQMWMTPRGESEPIKTTYMERPMTSTDPDGYFSLSGVSAAPNDYITIYYSNGDIEGVKVVSPADYGVQICDVTYVKSFTDDVNKVNYDNEVTVSGNFCDMTGDKIVTPIFTLGSPYVTDVGYEYSSGQNNIDYPSIYNSVAICDDYFEVSANINLNGRQVKKVVFTLDKLKSADVKYSYDAYVNQTEFVCDFGGKNMQDVFEPGDRLYITLYDAEDTPVKLATVDENGNTYYEDSYKETAYTKVFTGLDFYVPMVDAMPQVYEAENTSSALTLDLPVVGGTMASAKSGVLSFNKVKWNEMDGYSLVFDVNASVIGQPSKPASEVFKGVKESKNNAKEIAKDPTNLKDYVDNYSWWNNHVFDDQKKKDEIFKQAYKKSLTDTFSKNKINLNIVVLLNFDFMFSETEGDYLFTSGQVAIGGIFSIAHTFYTVLNGVPVYVQLSGSVTAEIQSNYTENQNLSSDKFGEYENILDALPEENTGLFLLLSGKIQAGVGICGVIGVRGIIGLDITIFVSFTDIEDDSGIMATLKGGFGIDLLIFSFEYTANIGTIGAGLYADRTGWGKSVKDVSLSSLMDEGKVRTYNMGSGAQVGENTGQVEASEITDYTVLIDDAPERTRPSIISLNDGRKMMVYIGSDASRTIETNENCLYYSIYENGAWSAAQPIENDGTADSTPALGKYGDDVVIVWSDASRAFTESDDELTMLSLFDISAVKFDTQTSTFGDVCKISDDNTDYAQNFVDYSPVVCADPIGENGVAVYYVKKDVGPATEIGQAADSTALYETIAMTLWDGESQVLKEEFPQIEGDPLVINLDGTLTEIPIGGEDHTFAICAYTIDRDGNLNDSNDWDVYLMFHDITEDKTYASINLCNDYMPDMLPQLTELNGDIYLTWISQSNAVTGDAVVSSLNSLDISSMLERMKVGTRSNSGDEWSVDLGKVFNGDNLNKDWYKKTADELGLSKKQYESSIFAQFVNNEFGISSTVLTEDKNIDTAFTDYKIIVGSDGNIYTIWTDSGSTAEDDYSIELYGVVKNNSDDDQQISSWSKPVKITDFSDITPNTVIDEFDATVAADGNFDLVSNMFTQEIDVNGTVVYSPNKLIEFTFDNSAVIGIDNAAFSDEHPAPGENAEIDVTIANDGLLMLSDYEAVVSIGGEEFGKVSSADSGRVILGGSSTTVTISGTVPSNISAGTTAEVTVTSKDGKSASYSMEVPYKADVTFGSGKISTDANGAIICTTTVTNNGNAPTGEFNIESKRYAAEGGLDENATVTTVASIAPGESREVQITFDSNTLGVNDFGKLGLAELSINAVSADGSSIGQKIMKVSADEYKQMIRLNGNVKSLDVEIDETVRLSAEKTPQTGSEQYNYLIADSSIATVENGYITGVKLGTTELTVTETASGLSETFTINVIEPKEDIIITPEPTKKPSHGGGSSSGGSTQPVTMASPEPSTEASTAPQPQAMPFTDVSQSDWFYSGVSYAYENGLMNGTSETTFEPNSNLTRGMMVTILGRAENAQGSGNGGFSDVDENEYYAPYVDWAVKNGIVEGNGDGTFAPDEPVSREQMAKIFLGYYNYKGEGPVGQWAIRLDYADLDQVSDWAVEGIMFCTMKGLMQGKENNLFDPQGTATRAETATVLMRAEI